MTWDQANNVYGCLTIAAETIGVVVSIWAFMVMQSASAQLAAGTWEQGKPQVADHESGTQGLFGLQPSTHTTRARRKR
jgi:hypothetical protein